LLRFLISPGWERLGHHSQVTSVTKMLPVQRVIRTFLEKRLLRLVQPFPKGCMDKLILNADKNADKWGRAPQALQLQGL